MEELNMSAKATDSLSVHTRHPDKAVVEQTAQSGATTDGVEHWRELAMKRLAKLVAAEHDASVLRDRMELRHSECAALIRQHGHFFLRNQQLEREVGLLKSEREQLHASWLWRGSAPLRAVIRRLRQARRTMRPTMRRVLRRVVKFSLLRPVVIMLVRALPGLSSRLHTRLHAKDR